MKRINNFILTWSFVAASFYLMKRLEKWAEEGPKEREIVLWR